MKGKKLYCITFLVTLFFVEIGLSGRFLIQFLGTLLFINNTIFILEVIFLMMNLIQMISWVCLNYKVSNVFVWCSSSVNLGFGHQWKYMYECSN